MLTNGSVGRYVDLSGINFDADDLHNYIVRSSSSIKSCVFEEDVY